MPRVGRVYQQALCYHVMNRGVNQYPIFSDDNDRAYFTRITREYKELYAARVYHWVWMGNHFHMLLEIAYDNLSRFVGGIQQSYAQYHHARHDSSGVFWQGRFKSKPVEIGPYLASCGRYIERNPVRGGLVAFAWEYRWSSAAAYVKKTSDNLTDENPYIGKLEDQARVEYRERLMAGDDEVFVRAMEGLRVIGTAEFASRLKKVRGRQRIKRGRPPITTYA